jgi:rhodanese-related sulfurtransferase
VDLNVVFYAVIALVVVLFVRRTMKIRALKHYGPSDVADLLKAKGNILLLDVRTAAEHSSGAIKGSINIPLPSLRSRLGELEKYKSKEIVCYCQTGNRSASAALLLRTNGFTVANMRGGMGEWNFAHSRSPA